VSAGRAAPPQFHTLSLHDALPIYGVRVASPLAARVLELGCGEGANLLPMALSYTEGRFTGIDLAPSAIHHADRWRDEVDARETRSEEHTSELQSREKLVCRLLLEK